MEKNIVNPIAALLFGILIAGTTTTVPGVETTGLMPINVESIVLEKNPWLGNKTTIPPSLASKINGETNGPGWMKKDPQAPKSPILAGAV